MGSFANFHVAGYVPFQHASDTDWLSLEVGCDVKFQEFDLQIEATPGLSLTSGQLKVPISMPSRQQPHPTSDENVASELSQVFAKKEGTESKWTSALEKQPVTNNKLTDPPPLSCEDGYMTTGDEYNHDGLHDIENTPGSVVVIRGFGSKDEIDSIRQQGLIILEEAGQISEKSQSDGRRLFSWMALDKCPAARSLQDRVLNTLKSNTQTHVWGPAQVQEAIGVLGTLKGAVAQECHTDAFYKEGISWILATNQDTLDIYGDISHVVDAELVPMETCRDISHVDAEGVAGVETGGSTGNADEDNWTHHGKHWTLRLEPGTLPMMMEVSQ